MKRINSELAILIVGRLLQVLIMLVAIRVSTKALEANEIGNLYLIISISGFFGLFLINPIGQYINRKTHEWYEESNIINIFYLYNYYIVGVSLFSIFVVYILNYIGIGNSINFFYLASFIALFVYFNTWNQTIIPMMNMLHHRISFVLFTIISQALFLLLSYIFITLYAKEGVFWFLGQTIAFGVVALIALVYFMKKIQSNFNISSAHKMIHMKNIQAVFRFSAPLSIGVLFLWMQTQSYGVIIEKYIGSEFLGFFGVGMTIALAISASFESIISQYLYPKMYESMKSKEKFSYVISNILNSILPLYFLLAIFVSLFSTYIITILADGKYFESYIYIIFGIWISFFRMSSNMVSNIAHATLKTKTLVYPYAIGGIFSVVGLIFASQLNYYEYTIPSVLMIGSLLSFVVMYLKMNQIVNIELKSKNYFFVLLYSVPFLSVYFLSLYSNNIIYATLIVGLFGVYFLYILYLIIKRGVGIES